MRKYKDWLLIYPLKRGNLPPGVNLVLCTVVDGADFSLLCFVQHFCFYFDFEKKKNSKSPNIAICFV